MSSVSTDNTGSTYIEQLLSVIGLSGHQASLDSHSPLTTATPVPVSSQAPPLYALCIGINDYKYSDKLDGCVADAEAAKKYLEDDLGVPPTQITLLTDAQATRAGMIAAFRALAVDTRIRSGDPIVVFYAGHGSDITAPAGWEAGDDRIQFLVPQDYCPYESLGGPVTFGIPDRTVGALLQDLARAKGDNISVIFDCCRSGSGTRQGATQSRRKIRGIVHPADVPMPPDLDVDIWGRDRSTTIPAGFLYAGLWSHVLLAACSAKEYSAEDDGRGLFSRELFKTLHHVGADKLTYRDVLYRMDKLSEQNPQCEGVNQNRILFNARAPSRARLLYAVSKSGDAYTLSAGSAHGITEEAEFTVYASREAFETSSPQGVLIVSETSAFTSKLKALIGTPPFPLPKPGVALQTLVGAAEELRLHIPADAAFHEILTKLLDDMQRTDLSHRRVVLVAAKDQADFEITLEDGMAVFHILQSVVVQYGASRIPHPIPPTVEETYPVIRAAADFNWHLKRTNRTPITIGAALLRDKIRIEFYKLELGTELDEDFNRTLTPVSSNLNVNGIIDLVVDEKAMYGVKIRNETDLPLYTSLFFFDSSDLSITSYFEPPTAGEYRLDPPLLPQKALAVGYGAGGGRPINYTLLKRHGTEVGFLKLFFSTEPVDLSNVAQASPFGEDYRGDSDNEVPSQSTWDTVLVAVVQRKAATG